MNDIELVIKIPEVIYTASQIIDVKVVPIPREVIANGTPLPKGHGRLIILSEDAVKREQTPLSFSCQKWISEVGLSNATLAIVESESEKE